MIQHNSTIEIQVTDTGLGISEEAIHTVFLPYEQENIVSKRDSGGIGLGLSISKQLVELHQGTLQVKSKLNEGSTFSFTLPISNIQEAGDVKSNTLTIINTNRSMIAAADQVVTAQSPEESSKFNILLVDDDAINLQVLTQTLETEGYTLSTAASAEQAIAEIGMNRYDLVISDVMMPHISGYELTKIIRERFNITELPILLLTARVRTEDIITGFQAGANDYVRKPADAWELRARVRALLELKSAIEESLHIEGAWLQSQIQPHFLYNTLNSIAALSLIDFEKMQSLLNEFSNYLRLSFDFKNADRLVTLENELNLVRSYTYIEQQRFGERINVEWNIDKDFEIMIPPLSIQPLVENAIKHGITSRNRGGTVTIAINKLTDCVEIVVQDDGVGMNERQIEQLFKTKPNSGMRSSVAIRNIDRRLKQMFQRGLYVQSSPNEGTKVSFQIPYSTFNSSSSYGKKDGLFDDIL